ncbi:protease inhibitor I42 family protein [Pseudomonas sp. GD04058]|uniref:protease inhibitor I42 family protein n=1 Tax=Pseudomonas sp. GD04058 TaxID=2975429 RepID=UPI00244D7A0D|nr:protease inhibitor I42 family protein [Pseudomonas sp. GD04058]MDG9884993.1 protease inhibitor I42 family protein [Pseudomonas sp. GD04058]
MTIRRTALLSGLTLLAACSHDTTRTEPVVVEKQSQCPIDLSIGQALTLTLPSNPSTGYRWQVQDAASSVLGALGPEVYRSNDNTGMVGSDGQSTWRFRAKGAGEGHLVLVYQQPWAPEESPVQRFDCTVKVR